MMNTDNTAPAIPDDDDVCQGGPGAEGCFYCRGPETD